MGLEGRVEGRHRAMQTKAIKKGKWLEKGRTQGRQAQGRSRQPGKAGTRCPGREAKLGWKVDGCPLHCAFFTHGLSDGPGCAPWPVP